MCESDRNGFLQSFTSCRSSSRQKWEGAGGGRIFDVTKITPVSYVLSKEEDGEDYEVELDPGEEVSRSIVDQPTQLTPIFMILYLYLSVVFRDKYHSCKYEKHRQHCRLSICIFFG